MSVVINTNVDSLRIQNILTNSTNKMSTSMQRMSTGMKINSAKDDAAGTVISARMAVQMDGNKICQNNVQNANAMLSTAEGNIDVVLENISRIRDLTLQAKNGTYSKAEIQAMQDEVDQRIAEIDRVSGSAKFSQLQLFGGEELANGATFQVGTNSSDINTISVTNDNNIFSSIMFNDLLGGDDTSIELSFSKIVSENIDPSESKVGDVIYNTEDDVFYICKENNSGTKEWVADLDFEYASQNYVGSFTNASAIATAFDPTKEANIGKVAYNKDTGKYAVCNGTNWTSVELDDVEFGAIKSEKDYELKGRLTTEGGGYYDSETKRLFGITEPTALADKNVGTYTTEEWTAAETAGKAISTTANTHELNEVYYCDQDKRFYICTKATEVKDVKINSQDKKVVVGYAEWEKLDSYQGNLKDTTQGSLEKLKAVAAPSQGDVYKVENVKDSTEDGYYMFLGTEWTKLDDYNAEPKKVSGALYTSENPFDLTKMDQKGFIQAIDGLDKAIDDLTARKSTIGSYQNRLDSALNTLTTQYSNLTSAKSIITDADIASEASAFTQNQILQQVSTSLLAQANQAPSIALSLL